MPNMVISGTNMDVAFNFLISKANVKVPQTCIHINSQQGATSVVSGCVGLYWKMVFCFLAL